MKGKLKKLSLLGASLCVAALLGEVAIRVVAPEALSGSYRVTTESGLRVNKSSGTARHQLGERVVHYSFSPPHLRDSRLVADEDTILCLGDSFTFGYLLEVEDSHVGRLQALTDAELGQGYNFVNAATAGWGAAEYVAYVEEFGAEVGPAVVLVFLNYDDIGRSARRGLYGLTEPSGYALTRNVAGRSSLKRGINSIPGYAWLVERSHLLHLGRRLYLALRSRIRPPVANVEPPTGGDGATGGLSEADCVRLGQALFARLDAWCRSHDARLLVTTPGWHMPADEPGQFEPTRAFLAEAPGFFEERGVPFRDVSPELQAAMGSAYEDFLIPDDHHPNERGAALTAELVFEHFLKGQLGR